MKGMNRKKELETEISESIEANKRKNKKENKRKKREKEEISNVKKHVLELNLTRMTEDRMSTKQMIEDMKASWRNNKN